MSFCQAASVMQNTKERSVLASIGTCSNSTFSKYARISCMISLHKVYNLLEEAWTFLVALEMSTHMSTFYLDIRIRLNLNKHGILNLHLIAIPVYKGHTAAVILDTAEKALDVLCTY